jgi:4-hydroxy-3-methylbut-2-enyl diphosphate reductase IspH
VTVVDPSRLKSFEIEGLKKVGIVSQPTQRKEDLSALVSNVSARASETRVFNTICDATSSRQGSVARLAGSVDGIIIIGGKNSANTEKLFEIANTSGTPTLWIEDEEGLEGDGWRTREESGSRRRKHTRLADPQNRYETCVCKERQGGWMVMKKRQNDQQ